MRYLWLIDEGHGGVINGVPQTAGKRGEDPVTGTYYEGVGNRRLGERLFKKLRDNCINYFDIVPDDRDMTLGERVRIANAKNLGRPCIYLSIHSDGFDKESANGWSAFTYYGQTKSDKVAEILYKYAGEAGLKLRTDFTDGDADKEANFYVLRETAMPAVLVENLFMTNKKDRAFLESEEGQETLVNIIFKTIQEIEQNGL